MSDKKQEKSCLNCVYCDTNIGTPMCYHARNGWRLATLLMFGPRALTSLNPCEFFSRAKGR